MALIKVAKINIIAHQKSQPAILEALQNSGFVQLEDYLGGDLLKKNLNEKISEFDYQLAGVKFCLDFLANYELKKKSLVEKINPKINLTFSEINEAVKNFDYQNKIKEIQEIESGLNETASLKEKLTAEKHQLLPWQNLNFIPSRKNLEGKFNFKFLALDQTLYLNLLNRLEKDLPLSAAEKVAESAASKQPEILAVIFFLKEKEDKLQAILAEVGAKTIELPDLEKTVPKRIEEIAREISQAENRMEKLTKQAQQLAANQKKLKIIFDYLNWQKEKLAGEQKAGHSWQTFSLIGWIDELAVGSLEKSLTKITDDFVIEKLLIGEDEAVPIIFKNTWAQPFEAVTDIYGTPAHTEPDPTPFLAPFFILFFGLCLTDAGYGIILAALAFLGLKILKLPRQNQKLLRVLMYGGIVTFIAGALVGGWFGIVIDELKIGWLKNLLVNIRIIDPVKEPIKMLIFCLILGISQVLAGLVIGLYWKIKSHDLKSAILDNGLWLYFLCALLFWAAAKFGLVTFAPAKYLVWAGALGLILTQGRSAKNPIVKIGTGIISLYGLIGYVSDVLSYSRLLALGLATGIIAMVINLIAKLTIDLVPYLGWVIAVFIIIGGHIFNIAINALGAFIHSSRLQFVEFFPKFMGEGGGKTFQPFYKESRYIKLINK